MRGIKAFLTVAAVMFALAAGAAGEQRIAVIDLERVFRDYYKSRIAEDAIKQQAEVFRSYLIRLNTELQKLQEEARTARLNSQNIALAGNDRAASVKLADDKARQVAEKKAEIELYATGRSEDMRKIEQTKRTEIMAEIRTEISRRAAAEGYAFVFDCSGKTMNEQPAVLLFPTENDLTEVVLTELNRTRTKPAATPTPITSPAAPAPVKP